ncbi:MAG: DinB family protein [Bacteroidetes bacterium]|nr:DinB family protein [Bacteroidota bacterium]
MKKSIIYFVFSVFVLSTNAFVNVENTTAKDSLTKSFSKMLESSKAYTLEIAEAMPEDKYTFKPTDSVRSFGEQMAHIGLSSQFLLNIFIKGEQPSADQEAIAEMEKTVGASKAEVITLLNKTFDDMIATLNSMDTESLNETFEVFFDPEKPKFTKAEGFQFLKDHIIHHRGQALVSLRMQGIKAPAYRLY